MDRKYFFEPLNKSVDITKIIENLSLYDSDIAFIAGSLVENKVGKFADEIGNAFSDIDIFIFRERKLISKQKYDVYSAKKNTNYFKYDNAFYDVEIYDKEEIIRIFKTINNSEISETKRLRSQINFPKYWRITDVNSIIHRFENSIPIFNEKNYYKLKQSLDMEHYFDIFKFMNITLLDSLRPDIIGNLNEKNFLVALHVARDYYLIFLKIIFNHNHITVDRDKWVVKKMLNLVDTKLKYQEIKKMYDLLFLSNNFDFITVQENIIKSMGLIDYYVEDMII